MNSSSIMEEIENYLSKAEVLDAEESNSVRKMLEGDDYLDHIDRVLVWRGSHGDKKARELFILEKMPYVRKIINGDRQVTIYKNKGLDEDDLFQTGIIGVIETVEKYDFRIDVKVRTFLACRVRFAIKNAYRCYGTISMSREANSIYCKFSRRFDLNSENISNNSLEILADEMGVDSSKISEAILAVKYCNSTLRYDSEGYTELDMKSMQKSNDSAIRDYNEKMERIFNYKLVLNSFSELTEKERYVMEEFFIKDRTQRFIALQIGCSVTTVGKIKKKAIEKIKGSVHDYAIEELD